MKATAPHLFLEGDAGRCTVCTLPEQNGRHTGKTCPECGHLAVDHRPASRGQRFCVVCTSTCKHS